MEILEHPLFLLLVGALLTGFLIPSINRQIQARQKELEIKVALVSELSEAIMKIVTNIQFAHYAPERYMYHKDEEKEEIVKSMQEKMNDEYLRWQIDSAAIGTKLEAYYPMPSSIPEEFDDLYYVIEHFYMDEYQKNKAITLAAERPPKSLDELFHVPSGATSWTWKDKIKEFKKLKVGLIGKVLDTRIQAVNPSWEAKNSRTM